MKGHPEVEGTCRRLFEGRMRHYIQCLDSDYCSEFDGTFYDDPIEGTEDALKKLSAKYTLICYTAKAKPDRMLINGKTGTEMIWEWLKKYNFDQYISKVTSEKPRAVAYIDDKAIKFNDWDSCLKDLKKGDII